jgi:hypothetical protein
MATHAWAQSAIGAVVNLDRPGRFLHWGVIQISLANFVVIVAMVALFAMAVLVPFPKGRHRHDDHR